MTETYLQFIAGFKIIWCGLFSILYGFGGIKHKYLRRFIGPLWMGIGILLFSSLNDSFHWLYLLFPILLCAALHLGYGGDDVLVKIRRRTIYGFAIAISTIPICIHSNMWTLFILHILLCVVGSTILGVLNPTRNARDEETLIASLASITPLFMI